MINSLPFVVVIRAFCAQFSLLLAIILTSIAPSLSLAKPVSVDDETIEIIKPTIRQARTAEEILIKLQRRHYSKLVFDDALSSQTLDSLIDSLDPGRLYFTTADIKTFEQYRFGLDDETRRGNLQPGYKIFNTYRKNAIAQLDLLLKTIESQIDAMDFTKEEYISLEPDTLPWAVSQAELDNRWRKQLKNSVLSLRLAEKDQSEIASTLKKRYKNQRKQIKQLNSDDAFQIYMNALSTQYDPHTNYFSPRRSENFSINMRLSLEGIGALLRKDGEHTVVERIIAAGPADKQGQLQPADKIVAVGQGRKGEMVDVVGWRLDEVVDLIRGKKNTTVRLNILSENAVSGDAKEIQIVRNTVKLEDQSAKKSVIDVYHNEQVHKLGIITIPAFYSDWNARQNGDPNYKSTTRDVTHLVAELEKENVDGVIIDLRGNGGGSLVEANELTGLFVNAGPVVQIRRPSGKILRQNNYPNGSHYRGPLAVVIDRLSASASEIFAGAIQDYQRGLIIGSQSFGKGTVQSLSELSHGSLKLTESKFYRVSGESTQHRGVVPDISLPSLYDMEKIGESTLDKALAWDQIGAIQHRIYGDIDAIEPALIERHQQRMSDDPDYQYLLKQIAFSNKYEELDSLSLNEKHRKERINADKAEQLRIENEFRKAKGLPPKKDQGNENNDDSNNENSEEVVDNNEVSTDIDDVMTDFILNEAGNILLDSISLQDAKLTASSYQ